MRKFTLFLAALLISMTAFSAKLYLTPNANWKQDNARFAAYFFGNGTKWISMTKVAGETDLYEVEAPAGYPSVIFCRMNPNASANDWGNKWNQTGDLTVPTDGTNHYTVKENTWDNGGGTWTIYAPGAPVTYTDITITVVANAQPKIHYWDGGDKMVGSDVNAKPSMVATGTANTYSYTIKDVNSALGVKYHLVVGDVQSADLHTTTNVTANFKDLLPQVVVMGVNNWDGTDKMVVADDYKTASITLNLAAKTYEWKLTVNGSWFGGSKYAITRDKNSIAVTDNGDGNGKLTADLAGEYVFTYTYATKNLTVTYPVVKPAITATWSMADGASVEIFEEATITFTGVESADLKSMYTACLYKVNEDNTIAIAESNCGSGGILDRVATGATIKLSIFDEYGDDYCWKGKLPAGNYRIVLAPGTVKFNGDKENLNTEEYSLNFTITKGNVIPPVEVTVAATPANNSTIKEFTSVEVTLVDLPMIQSQFQPMGNPSPETWPFLWLTRNGELLQPVLPLNMMQTNANVVTVSVIASMNEDKESWSTEGEYAVVIPENLIMVSASEFAARIVLNYTIGEPKPAEAITATWSIEDGAELASFTSVDVTFSGVDALGRVLGEEVKLAATNFYDKSLFFSVDEAGNRTPVVTDKQQYGTPGSMEVPMEYGVLTLTRTLTLSEDMYKLIDGAYVRNGKYCIVIPKGTVKFRVDYDDDTEVYNEEEYVLNFTIKNDIVMPEAVKAEFKVTPDTSATSKVESLTEVIIEFTEYETITIKETADDGYSTYAECGVYEEFESFYGDIYTEWMSKATMSWSAVEGKPNALRLYVDAAYSHGDTVLLTPNTYIVRIPAGVAYFTDTKFNETLELRITVDNEAIEVTKVEEVEANPYKRLLYKGLELEVKKVAPYPEEAPDYIIDQAFIAGSNVPVSGLTGIVPLKLDVYGVYKKNYVEEYGFPATPTFVIEEVVAVQKFNLFSDMISYLEDATDAEKALSYEVAEEVVVSFVNPRGGCVYLQYGVMIRDGRDMIESSRGVKAQYIGTDLAVGDKVTVKGKYQPMVAVYDEYMGGIESIEATGMFVAETITKVASKQAIPAYEVADMYTTVGGDIAGTYVALLDGKVVEKDGAYFYERTIEFMDYETWESVQVLDSMALVNVGNIEDLVKETEEPLYAIVEFDVVSQEVQIWAIGYGDYYTPEVEVSVENVKVANIYTENGKIVAEGEFAIYTITGQNVTLMNGRLASGIYVVRTADTTAKVFVK